jgi:hypothetical protein
MKSLSTWGAAGLAVPLCAAVLTGGCGDDNMTAANQSATASDQAAMVSFDGKVNDIQGLHLDVSGGWSIDVDGGTQVVRNGQRITLHDLQVGERVEGRGHLEPNGQTVLATKINAL